MIRSVIQKIVLCSLVSSGTVIAAEIPKQSDAKAQIKFARSLKKETHGLKGEEKREKLKEVALAYASVPSYFPNAAAENAEAYFRLGGIRRSINDREGAMLAYEKTLETNGNRKFSARALLEIGHLHRRAKSFDTAIASYEKIGKDFADQADQRDSGLIWIGKLRFQQKNSDAARAAWQQVAEKGEDPVDRAKAYDLIAGSYLSESKQGDAAATIEKCKQVLAPFAEEPGTKGARVKRALEKLKTPAKLSPEVADADDGTPDEEES